MCIHKFVFWFFDRIGLIYSFKISANSVMANDHCSDDLRLAKPNKYHNKSFSLFPPHLVFGLVRISNNFTRKVFDDYYKVNGVYTTTMSSRHLDLKF